jgi:hypothetical protein
VIDKDGNPIAEGDMKAAKSIVLSSNGEPLPIEIMNKSIHELKEMGFKDMISFDVKRNPITQGLKPKINEDEKRKLLKILKEMNTGEEDPSFHEERIEDAADENLHTNEDKSLFKKIVKQREIDDRKIAVYYKALEKGIFMPDDEVYSNLLSSYPYYRKKL